jgi:hypothetical protein
MPIPTQADYAFAEIDNAAASIMCQLRTMQRAAAPSLPAMRARLRDMCAEYFNLVMSAARDA